MYEPYLEHTGVKGMKWGERRYQNRDGSLTPLGREHYGVGPARKALDSAIKKAKKGVKQVKTKVKNIAKKIKTKTNEHAEKSLSKAISRGNVKNILKYVDRLDEKELNDALKRAKTVKDLSDLRAPKEKVTAKIRDIANTIGDIGSAASKINAARKQSLEYKQARDKYNKKRAEEAAKEREKWDARNKEDMEKIKEKWNSAKNEVNTLKAVMFNNAAVDEWIDKRERAKAFDEWLKKNGKLKK